MHSFTRIFGGTVPADTSGNFFHYATLTADGWCQAAGLDAAPEHYGPVGAFWTVRRPGASPCVLGEWALHLPLADPRRCSYAAAVVHLRDVPGFEPPRRFAPYMTHEFVLAAHDPRWPLSLSEIRAERPYLVTGQFSCGSDQAALRLARRLLELCCADGLSPGPGSQDDWARYLVVQPAHSGARRG